MAFLRLLPRCDWQYDGGSVLALTGEPCKMAAEYELLSGANVLYGRYCRAHSMRALERLQAAESPGHGVDSGDTGGGL